MSEAPESNPAPARKPLKRSESHAREERIRRKTIDLEFRLREQKIVMEKQAQKKVNISEVYIYLTQGDTNGSKTKELNKILELLQKAKGSTLTPLLSRVMTLAKRGANIEPALPKILPFLLSEHELIAEAAWTLLSRVSPSSEKLRTLLLDEDNKNGLLGVFKGISLSSASVKAIAANLAQEVLFWLDEKPIQAEEHIIEAFVCAIGCGYPDVQIQALDILYKQAYAKMSIQELCYDQGIVDTIYTLITSNSPIDVQTKTCRLIVALCSGNSNVKRRMREKQILLEVVEVLKNQNGGELMKYAALALAEMCVEDRESRLVVADKGVIDVLINMLKDEESVATVAAYSIDSLVSRDGTMQSLFTNTEVIQLLLDLLSCKDASENLLIRVSEAILDLIRNHEKNQEVFERAGLISAIVDLLEEIYRDEGFDNIQYNCVGITFYMCSANDAYTTNFQKYKDGVVLPILEHLSESSNKHVKKGARALFKELSIED